MVGNLIRINTSDLAVFIPVCPATLPPCKSHKLLQYLTIQSDIYASLLCGNQAAYAPYERRLIEKDITRIYVIQPLSRERIGACRGKMAVRGDRTQNRPKFGNRVQVSTTNMLVEFTICLRRLMAVIWLTQIIIDFTKAFVKLDHTIRFDRYNNKQINLEMASNFLCQ